MKKSILLPLLFLLISVAQAQLTTKLTKASGDLEDILAIIHADEQSIYTVSSSSKFMITKVDRTTGQVVGSTKLKHRGSADERLLFIFQEKLLVVPSNLVVSQDVASSCEVFNLDGKAEEPWDLFTNSFSKVDVVSSRLYLRISDDGDELYALMVVNAKDGTLHYEQKLFDRNCAETGRYSAELEAGTRYTFSSFRYLENGWVNNEFVRKDGSGKNYQFINLKTGDTTGKFTINFPDEYLMDDFYLRSLAGQWQLYGVCVPAENAAIHKRPFVADIDLANGELSNIHIPEMEDHRTTENGFSKTDKEVLEMRPIDVVAMKDGALDFIFFHQSTRTSSMFSTVEDPGARWFKTKGISVYRMNPSGELVDQVFVPNDYKLDSSTGAMRITHCGFYPGPESNTFWCALWLKSNEEGVRLNVDELSALMWQIVGFDETGWWTSELAYDELPIVESGDPTALSIVAGLRENDQIHLPVSKEKETVIVSIGLSDE